MTKTRAAITAIEGYVPDYVLTNEELSKMMDTNDEWITTRIGVKERRILKGAEAGTSDMAVVAINKLLEKKNIKPEEIDLVICCTVTSDFHFPVTANVIADKCGIRNGFGFDLSLGCAGFVYGLKTAALYVESGFSKKVLLVGADKMSAIMDYTDRATSPIFGDGAGVVLLEPTSEDIGIMDAILCADGAGGTHLHMKAGGSVKPPTHETVDNKEHFVYQEGQAVFKWAVSKMADVSEEIMLRNNLTENDIAYLVPHQANMRIIDAVGQRMKLSKEKVMVNITKYGNTTNATIPLLLWEYQDKLKKGDNLIVSAFGAGFAWGSVWIKWAI